MKCQRVLHVRKDPRMTYKKFPKIVFKQGLIHRVQSRKSYMEAKEWDFKSLVVILFDDRVYWYLCNSTRFTVGHRECHTVV